MTSTKIVQKQQAQKQIIVTEHPSIPCSGVYIDVFESILVICKDKEHTKLLLNKNGIRAAKLSK